MKKLQVALDLFSTEATLKTLQEIGEFVDIIELGTPLIIAEGSRVIRDVKERYPDKMIFADIKVMDGGSVVSKIAFEAGAEMVSVLAVAEDQTLTATIECAKGLGRKVLVDMCAVHDIELRGKQVDQMNPDYICVHVGYDIQSLGVDPVAELRKLKGVNAKKAIAGGVKLETFEAAIHSDADVIIVGGGIYNQQDMRSTAREMRRMLDEYNAKHGG